MKLLQELYEGMQQLPITDTNPLISMKSSGLADDDASPPNVLANFSLRRQKYSKVLSHLRQVMIEHGSA